MVDGLMLIVMKRSRRIVEEGKTIQILEYQKIRVLCRFGLT